MSDDQTIERIQQEVVSANRDKLYQATKDKVYHATKKYYTLKELKESSYKNDHNRMVDREVEKLKLLLKI